MGLLDNDYGAGAISAAVKGLMQGMQQGDEMSMRREERDENKRFREMELSSRMRAEDEKRAREAALDKYNKEKDAAEIKRRNFESGVYLDEQGNPDYAKGYRPEYLAMKRERDGQVSDPYGLKAMAAQKAREELDKTAREKTPIGRVSKLSGDMRKRFDDTTGSLDALVDVENAFNQLHAQPSGDDLLGGFETKSKMMGVPLRGDTDYTAAANRFKEFIGRLQSGGAIGKQEAQDFKNLIPTAFDNEAVARNKIKEMKFRLGSRLRSFEITPDEAAQAGFLKPTTAKGLLVNGLIDQADNSLLPENSESIDPVIEAKKARRAELLAKKAKGGMVANGSN